MVARAYPARAGEAKIGRAIPCSMRAFFLLLVGAPRCTLFPYTTLFRSDYMSEDDADDTLRAIVSWGRYAELFAYDEQSETFSLDRKSTRLNSSHQITSYAVFCLKKKREAASQVLLRRLAGAQNGREGVSR